MYAIGEATKTKFNYLMFKHHPNNDIAIEKC